MHALLVLHAGGSSHLSAAAPSPPAAQRISQASSGARRGRGRGALRRATVPSRCMLQKSSASPFLGFTARPPRPHAVRPSAGQSGGGRARSRSRSRSARPQMRTQRRVRAGCGPGGAHPSPGSPSGLRSGTPSPPPPPRPTCPGGMSPRDTRQRPRRTRRGHARGRSNASGDTSIIGVLSAQVQQDRGDALPANLGVDRVVEIVKVRLPLCGRAVARLCAALCVLSGARRAARRESGDGAAGRGCGRTGARTSYFWVFSYFKTWIPSPWSAADTAAGRGGRRDGHVRGTRHTPTSNAPSRPFAPETDSRGAQPGAQAGAEGRAAGARRARRRGPC